MSSAVALADSSQRGKSAYDKRDSDSYDYNVPLALPPYGYSPSFWGYGCRRFYDRLGNYKKYGQRASRGGAERGFKSPRARLGTAVIQLCYSAAPERKFA